MVLTHYSPKGMAHMADNITPQRSYASGIRFTIFDLVSFAVDAVPQARPNVSKDSAMRRVAVIDGAPVAVEQRFVTTDGTVYEENQLGRARDLGDGTLVQLDADTVITAKVGDLAKNELTISVHPASQVEHLTLPGGGGYRLRPSAKASTKERELYATVRAAVAAAPDKAFVGLLRLRDSRAMYRLVVWQDQLVIQELAQPADLAAADVIDVAPDEAILKLANELVANATTDFVPAAYHHDVLGAFEQAVSAAPVVSAPVSGKTDAATDMFALALAATKPVRKRAARKAPARKTAAKAA